ncbi:MAG: hypothetical protein ACRDAP_03470 [Shewanella sp.]
MREIFIICTMVLLCANVTAAPLERALNISVNVVVNQSSSQLEIVAPQSDFLVTYLSSLSSFQPLGIPFSVRQIDGASHSYELTLIQLTGMCSLPGGATSALTPSVLLDSNPFDATSPGIGYANPEQAHVLTLIFPAISQANTSQVCNGAVGVVAAVIF